MAEEEKRETFSQELPIGLTIEVAILEVGGGESVKKGSNIGNAICIILRMQLL